MAQCPVSDIMSCRPVLSRRLPVPPLLPVVYPSLCPCPKLTLLSLALSRRRVHRLVLTCLERLILRLVPSRSIWLTRPRQLPIGLVAVFVVTMWCPGPFDGARPLLLLLLCIMNVFPLPGRLGLPCLGLAFLLLLLLLGMLLLLLDLLLTLLLLLLRLLLLILLRLLLRPLRLLLLIRMLLRLLEELLPVSLLAPVTLLALLPMVPVDPDVVCPWAGPVGVVVPVEDPCVADPDVVESDEAPPFVVDPSFVVAPPLVAEVACVVAFPPLDPAPVLALLGIAAVTALPAVKSTSSYYYVKCVHIILGVSSVRVNC